MWFANGSPFDPDNGTKLSSRLPPPVSDASYEARRADVESRTATGKGAIW